MSVTLADYIQEELKNNRSFIGLTAIRCREVMCSKSEGFWDFGEIYGLSVSKETAQIKSVTDESDNASFTLIVFLETLIDHLVFLLKDKSEPVKIFFSAPCEQYEEDELVGYGTALNQLIKNSEELEDEDATLLFEAFQKLQNSGNLTEADIASELITRLAQKKAGAMAEYMLVQLVITYVSLKQPNKAESCLKKVISICFTQYNPPSAVQKELTQKLLEMYIEIFEQRNNETELQEFYEHIKESAGGIVHLMLQLYKSCGLYNEYLKSTGMASMADKLRAMMHGGNNDAFIDPGNLDSSKFLTMNELESRLKIRIPRNAEAVAAYKQLINLRDTLKNEYGQLVQNKQKDFPELFLLLEEHLEFVLNSVKTLEFDLDEVIDLSPDSTEESLQDYIYDDVAIDLEMIPELLSRLKKQYNYDPSTPNAQPVLLWKQYKYGLLIHNYPRMARQLSYVGMSFIDYFHNNKGNALEKFMGDFESAFAGDGKFIHQCFGELAAFYEASGVSEGANIFKLPIVTLVDEPVKLANKAEPVFVEIFFPLEAKEFASEFNKIIAMEIVMNEVQWGGIDCTYPEDISDVPEKKFALVKIETQETNCVFDLVKNKLIELGMTEGVYIRTGKKLETIG